MTMTTDLARPLAFGSTDELGPPPARWYCVSNDGMATLCKDEEDARANARHCDLEWPKGAPHRAVMLGDIGDERKRWRTLLSRAHVFNGSCPDAENWHDRDPECPACRALGSWRA